jgi:hypothetical protein
MAMVMAERTGVRLRRLALIPISADFKLDWDDASLRVPL